MLPQRRANVSRFRQPIRKLQRTRHLRLARAIATRHLGDQLPRLQLRMPQRLAHAQYRFNTSIQLGKQRAEFGKVMLLELNRQRILEHLLLRRLWRQSEARQLFQA
ncbi:hypothetical protein D3C84_902180 [compost metagenome]